MGSVVVTLPEGLWRRDRVGQTGGQHFQRACFPGTHRPPPRLGRASAAIDVSAGHLSGLRQAVPLGFAALGQSLVIIGRSLDLSVGGVVALVNVLLALRTIAQGPGWFSISVALGVGAAVGLINGFLVAWVRASAVIVTLGMSIILVGVSYLVSGGSPGGQVSPLVRWLATGRIETFPVAVAFWIATAFLFFVALRTLTFGKALVRPRKQLSCR